MVGASPSTYSPVETGSEDLRETDADNELRVWARLERPESFKYSELSE